MEPDPSILSRLDLGLFRKSFLGAIEKLLTNGGNVLPGPAGIRQRAVEAASPLADAVSVPETEHELQAARQPSLSGVAKGILGWCCQPSLKVAAVRRLRIASAHISLPGSGQGSSSSRAV